jgi:hypothetical protein
VGVGEPGDGLVDQVQPDEDVVDEPAGVVEDPAPVEGGHHRRNGPGKEQKRAEQIVTEALLVEHQRHAEPEEEFDPHPDRGVDDGVEHRAQELLAREQLAVIVQSDEAPGAPAVFAWKVMTMALAKG